MSMAELFLRFQFLYDRAAEMHLPKSAAPMRSADTIPPISLAPPFFSLGVGTAGQPPIVEPLGYLGVADKTMKPK